jgi:predicted MFS family arabinose efflux permease
MTIESMPMHSHHQIAPWRATLSGLCATLVGIGLARFAYTPLIPVLITSQWFTAAQADYLGAANLAGYLAGALMARPLTRRIGTAPALRLMMLPVAAAFFACAVPLSFTWFFVWRFSAGIAGGVLMVLAAPAVLATVPPSRRGLAGGAIFTGVGLGIAASGTLVPLLLQVGLVETWLGLGALALMLTILAWGGWPSEKSSTITNQPRRAVRRLPPALTALYVEYALNAIGQVAHMVFLVDFVARGLGRGLAAGAVSWVLFGLGAMVGPSLTGTLADRVGFRTALRLAFLIQSLFVGTLAVTADAGWLFASSIVIGAFVPGVVPLALGRVHDLATSRRKIDVF